MTSVTRLHPRWWWICRGTRCLPPLPPGWQNEEGVVAVSVVVAMAVVERTVEARFWKGACAKPLDRLFVSVIAS